MKKYFKLQFYIPKCKEYKKIIENDYKFNAKFRDVEKLPLKFLYSYEWKCIKCYRHYQVNADNIWGILFKFQLDKLEQKTGISFEGNLSIGNGLIIGHWGKIIINGQVKFGNMLFITHGVTIGRDVRGKRKGVPNFGDKICIRANSTVVGNINIGNDVLIAPNTFVNFDVPDHSIVIGNPATIHPKQNATEGHIPNDF